MMEDRNEALLNPDISDKTVPSTPIVHIRIAVCHVRTMVWSFLEGWSFMEFLISDTNKKDAVNFETILSIRKRNKFKFYLTQYL